MGRLLRRDFLAAAPALLAMGAVRAQPRTRVYRIGVLSALEPGSVDIDEEMRALGYDVGRNCIIEYRYANRDPSKLQGFADELVKLKLDVIVADLPPSIVAARRATSTIPIVMVWGMSPKELGLIESLARPGGNVTGTLIQTPGTTAKTIEILRDIIGRQAAVAFLYQPEFPGLAPYMAQMEQAATASGLRPTMVPVQTDDQLEGGLERVRRELPKALVVVPTGAFGRHPRRVLQFAADQRIPAIFTASWPVELGALFAYDADGFEGAMRAIAIIDKILKGANPAEIPVEEPTRFRLWINMKTAKTLGLKIPQSVLLQATRIFD